MKILSANHYWRIFAAGLSYIVFGVGALLPGLYMLGLAILPINAASKQLRVRRAIQLLCRFYVGFMQFLGLLKYEISGLEGREIKGQLLISNHSMLIDALFILGYVDNLCCVVKAQLLSNPFTRIPVKLAGYIPNNSSEFVELACEKLKQGENVLIFPEGTRNQYDTQLDFKRGAANIAVMSNCSVLPITIVPFPRTVQKGESWYQLPTQKSLIEIDLGDNLRLADCLDVSLARTVQYRRLNKFWREYYLNKITQLRSKLQKKVNAA